MKKKMKKLENKAIKLKFEENKKLGYADLALICLNQVPEKGLLPLEMSERIDLIKKMKAVVIGNHLELSEDEMKMLTECKNNTAWRLIHEDIDTFNKHIDNIKN